MPDVMKVEYNVRVLQEAASLQSADYDVKVVGFSNKTQKRSFEVGGVSVISFYLHDSRRGFGKILRILTALKVFAGIYLFTLFYKADIYHAHNFHVLPVCFLSAIFHRGKLIYDTHESWIIHQNMKYHPEHVCAFIIEKLFLRFVDAFITVNEMVANFYAKTYGVLHGVILYNTRKFEPIKNKNLIRKKCGFSKNDVIVLFVGGFWPSGRSIMELIQSTKYLADKFKIVFMGYGSNNMLAKMRREIRAGCAESNVFILAAQPPGKVMDYVMSADIGANLIQREGRAQDFQSPWKLFEYLLGGLPVVSTNLPFHRKVYEKYNIGLLCDGTNSPESIADAITQIATNKSDLFTYRANARRAAEKQFNWEKQEEKLVQLYKEVLNEQ